MAFVSRAERNFDHSPTKGFNLGPGSYLGQDQYKQQHAYAPFCSTAERDPSQSMINGTTPGPGSYSSPFLNTKPNQGNLDQYGRPRLSGPFASRQDRFKGENSHLAPGPGSYQVEKPWIKPRRQSPKQDLSTLNWLRLPSAPSIPAPKHAFGYDETPNGELIMQKNPEKVFDGTPQDCVGPGHYETKSPSDIWKTSKGPNWARSKAPRVAQSQPPTSSDIGPGSYNQLPGSLAPMYKFKPSAVFQSGTKRSSYIPANGKPAIPDGEISEEFDETMQDETTPGPGYYFNQEKMTAFKPKQVPERLQFFGSTAARFVYKKDGNPKVGPGSYSDVKSASPDMKRPIRESKAPFASSNLRFQEQFDLNPGPGSYKDPGFLDEAKKKAWGRQGVFGTTEKRFAGGNPIEMTPGPGYYPPDADRRIGMHNSAHHKPFSVFQSRSKRTVDSIKTSGPAPGQYDLPSSFDLKAVPQGAGNPLLAGLADNNRRKDAGFNVKSQRFPSPPPPDALGPGCYNPKLPQEIKVEKQKPIFMPQVRFTQESRFKEKQLSLTPGPGTYDDEVGADWNKRSYNILFTEYV